VAVVTGSSKGIGKAIANQFVKSGYCVVLNARDEGNLKQAAEDIAKEAGNNQMVSYRKIFVYL
jgi:short-subunit dehydrogenase